MGSTTAVRGCLSSMPATATTPRLAPDQHTTHDRDLRFGRWTWVRLGIVAAAVLGALWAVHAYGRRYTFFDLRIYHGAMVWWTHGGNLYDFVSRAPRRASPTRRSRRSRLPRWPSCR